MTLEFRVLDDPQAWRESLVARLVPRARSWRPDPRDARRHAESDVDRLLPGSQVGPLLDGDHEVGWLWLGDAGGDLVVFDLVLEDLACVDGVRRMVHARARAAGFAGVRASARPEDAVRAAFVDDATFTLVATNMRLDLPDPAVDPDPRVALVPMTAANFATFDAGQVETYAAERHEAGEPYEVALETSRKQLGELLPDGLTSADQHLFTVRAAGAAVGILWLSTEKPVMFVYDIELAPEHRGRGLGRAVMVAAAGWAHRVGAPAIGLNVFGPNATARGLYDSLGYQVVEDRYRSPLY